MTNVELMTNPECCRALPPDRRDVVNIGCAKVERVVHNALRKTTASTPEICAFGDQAPIVFGKADPPWARRLCPLARARAKNLGWSLLQTSSFGHSFVIGHSSFVIFRRHIDARMMVA